MDVDAAAISLRFSEQVEELVAASNDWAQTLEELQYTFGEGPGVEAGKALEPVLVCDLQAERARWPGFTDRAVPAGLGAMFAFPLAGGATRLGTLDLYRRRPGPLPTSQLTEAALLADVATVALLDGTPPDRTAGWSDAPSHYEDVNVATGILAARLGVDVDEAFVLLRAHAFGSGSTLFDVAHAVLSHQLDGAAFQKPTQ